ncbi:MAG: ATP-binding cassette domain-containing protein [Candidatus Micrarchaeota archaeon]
MAIIETKGLTRKFGSFTAVDGLSLAINEGEIFGLLGPNGAGKTTTISMLCTILKPTAGTGRVNGFDIDKEQDNVRKSIGIVFQDGSLDEELTAMENLEMHGRLYGLDNAKIKERSAEVLEIVELADRRNDVVKTFSGGMRRRLEIGRGLMHFPKVLFLDEPTIGLDPQTRDHIWEYILKLKNEQGITIVLTTHYMEEAEKLCDRIAIIDHAKIILLGTPGELKGKLDGQMAISIVVAKEQIDVMMKLLEGQKFIKKISKTQDALNLSVNDQKGAFPAILDLANKNHIKIESIETHRPSLNDVFIHFTGRDLRKESAEGMSAMMRARMRR